MTTPPSEPPPRVRILNVDLDNVTRRELLERFTSGVVFTVNVDFLVRAQSDREFLELQRGARFSVADGQVVVFASRFLRTPVKERIAGADLLPAFCQYHRENTDVRVFLLGTTTDVAEAAMRSLNRKTGRDIVVGALGPSYGFETNREECLEVVAAIDRSGATVLAIGVGSPKQEKWIAAWGNRLDGVRMFLPVGSAIDFAAGARRRAPAWLGRVGLEWLHRLAQEPRRLWRRYLLEDPRFFRLLLAQRLGRYQDPFRDPDSSA